MNITRKDIDGLNAVLTVEIAKDDYSGKVEKILAGYGVGAGHVFNLGHGISQFTPPENALSLVEAVHGISRKFCSQ